MTYSSSHSKLVEELEPNPARAQQQRPQHYVLLAWALPTDAPGLTLALPAVLGPLRAPQHQPPGSGPLLSGIPFCPHTPAEHWAHLNMG